MPDLKTNTQSNTILILTDFSEASAVALRTAAKFAKSIQGNLLAHYVHPVKPMAEEQNQLTLRGKLRESQRQILSKAKKIMTSIEENEGVKVEFTMAHGNVKTHVLNKIKETNPDLVILGRREQKFFNIIGDRVTQFVIDQCDVNVLISSRDNELHSFTNLSLGFFGDTIENSEFQIIDHLQESTHSVNYFGIRSRMSSEAKTSLGQKTASSYVFPQDGMDAIEALTAYVMRSNTQLFCIPKNSNTRPQPVKELVNRLDIPILVYK